MLRTALTALAGVQVTGVVANYDVDAVPEQLFRGNLPILVVLPLETDVLKDRRLFRERGRGFEAVAFSDGVRTVTYTVTHLLLVAPAAAGRGLQTHLPTLIDLIDSYFAAIGDDVTLGGALLEPAQVAVEPGTFAYGGVDFIGCAFWHTWVMQL